MTKLISRRQGLQGIGAGAGALAGRVGEGRFGGGQRAPVDLAVGIDVFFAIQKTIAIGIGINHQSLSRN